MFYDHDVGWWGYTGMGAGMVIFWAVAVFGLIAAIVYVCRDRSPAAVPHSTTAEQILADRFARGEIDETEYRQRAAVLHSQARQ